MQQEARTPSGWWFAIVFAALLVLALVAPLVSVRAAWAQQENRLDCADFPSQEAAQRELDQNPSDPNNLDADNDGQACDEFNYASSGTGGGTTGGDQVRHNTTTARGAAHDQYTGEEPVIKQTIPNKGHLEKTGGPPLLLLGAGAVLLSSGLLLGRYVIQRS